MIRRITTRAGLVALAKELRVRPDWHEPDEREVTAEVHGENFDNAGFWGEAIEGATGYAPASVELYVTLHKDGEPVADVNLATLFAWATGYRD